MKLVSNNDFVAPAVDNLGDDSNMFEVAPVSLWLEDYSELKVLLDEWRQAGIADLRRYLVADRSRVEACVSHMRIVRVNRRTLSLFEVDDLPHLVANLDAIFRDEMFLNLVDELVQLWDGKAEFVSHGVNYSLSGRRIDIQLKGAVLPGYEASWERVLIAVEDVSEREGARRLLALSEDYSRGLFEHSPISLWVEDFSAVKLLMDEVRERGIEDFRVFTDVHPEFVQRCMSEIRVVDVNAHTLTLFGAPDKQTLLFRLRDIFRDATTQPFREQLIDLWNGKLFQQREVVNYALDGAVLHLHLQFSVFPGRESDWSLVQVALTDISARKKAEAYLEFLGKHDVLTKLYNRSFYVDELNRLERTGPATVTVVVVDVNDLKAANDQFGHAVGDELLRRAGEVLNKLVEKPCHAARIGGDEFVILMPGSEQRDGEAMIANIGKLVELNNQFYPGLALSFAMGATTRQPGERLEEVVRRADAEMYAAKRAYYSDLHRDRRESASLGGDDLHGTPL
ncbi:sensor domain-containing diguanylate cyclase [Methylocapsa sp. S129]|uniref:sensor domain-containing diguanylate cyclase n=1 Tax=Methylocapsa sp. S129 TaxID=1641869 RepID=UPI00131D5A49|nr:sensor domain-containing diguanylate cyclase [Methylocapsa sp. S129]